MFLQKQHFLGMMHFELMSHKKTEFSYLVSIVSVVRHYSFLNCFKTLVI